MSHVAARPVGILRLLTTASAVSDVVDARLSAVGLSISRLAVLRRLADAGAALPLGQLADRLACVKSNVTQLVDRLEADGLVARATDPADKRSRLAVLTDAGRDAYLAGARIQEEAEQEILAVLSPDDVERLGDIIAKLHHACKR